jgi:hypothetical protein
VVVKDGFYFLADHRSVFHQSDLADTDVVLVIDERLRSTPGKRHRRQSRVSTSPPPRHQHTLPRSQNLFVVRINLCLTLPINDIFTFKKLDYLNSTTSLVSKVFTFSIHRAAFNYELSLFVVKNLCYIFMLVHSLYPGITWMIHNRKSKKKSLPPSEAENTADTNTTEDISDEVNHFII